MEARSGRRPVHPQGPHCGTAPGSQPGEAATCQAGCRRRAAGLADGGAQGEAEGGQSGPQGGGLSPCRASVGRAGGWGLGADLRTPPSSRRHRKQLGSRLRGCSAEPKLQVQAGSNLVASGHVHATSLVTWIRIHATPLHLGTVVSPKGTKQKKVSVLMVQGTDRATPVPLRAASGQGTQVPQAGLLCAPVRSRGWSWAPIAGL